MLAIPKAGHRQLDLKVRLVHALIFAFLEALLGFVNRAQGQLHAAVDGNGNRQAYQRFSLAKFLCITDSLFV